MRNLKGKSDGTEKNNLCVSTVRAQYIRLDGEMPLVRELGVSGGREFGCGGQKAERGERFSAHRQ